jgi:hypothetical protein
VGRGVTTSRRGGGLLKKRRRKRKRRRRRRRGLHDAGGGIERAKTVDHMTT